MAESDAAGMTGKAQDLVVPLTPTLGSGILLRPTSYIPVVVS